MTRTDEECRMLTQSGTTVPGSDTAFLSDSDPLSAFSDRSLLIVDDDRPFSTRLARAMESRGYEVHVAESVSEGVAAVENKAPAFAVIDMRLGDGNGLDVIAVVAACPVCWMEVASSARA